MTRKLIESVNNQSTLKNGLILNWKLDELSGTTAYDSFSTYNGSISGCTLNQDGIINKSFYFFGGTGATTAHPQYVQLPLRLSSQNPFSISMWLKNTDPYAQSNYVIDEWSGYDKNYLCYLSGRSDGTYRFVLLIGDGGDNQDSEFYSSWVNYNEWVHLVIFRTGTTRGYYINTTKSSTTGTYQGGTYTGNYPALGKNAINAGTLTTGGFTGYIEQFCIHNRMLTQTEVDEMYNNGTGLGYINF